MHNILRSFLCLRQMMRENSYLRIFVFWISRLLNQKRELEISLYGARYFIRTTNLDIYTILESKKELDVFLSSHPPKIHSLVLDAGAYIGSFCIPLALRYPHLKIVALEPFQENFELLQRNILLNAVRIEALNLALVGERDCGCKLPFGHGGSALSGEIIIEKPVKLRKITRSQDVLCIGTNKLLQYSGENNVGLLKLDIEGAEVDVLTDLAISKVIVDLLIVELHERKRIGCNAAFEIFSRNRVNLQVSEKFFSVRQER